MKIPYIKNLVLILPLLMFLAACGVAPTEPPQETVVMPGGESEVEVTPTYGGEIVFAQWSNPPSLDPAASNDTVSTEVQAQIFEGLTTFDQNGNVIGLLATDFNLIEDTVWEFHLRQGVTFHDGTPFNAYSVVISILRLINPELAFPRAFILNMLEDVVAVDEYTVHFITQFPFSPLPAHLAHPGAFIISPASIEDHNNGVMPIYELPIGTGPFRFYSRTHGEEVLMLRNDDYWGVLAVIDSLRFVVIPESGTRLNMLLTGEANAAVASAVEVDQIRESEQLQLMEIYSSRLNYIGLNLMSPPFDDIRVRQAIAMVTDLDSIVYAIGGMGIAAAGPLSPIVAGSAFGQVQPLTGTVEEARELLAEAGFPDGFNTSITLGAGRPLEEGFTAQILQQNLLEIGINATINEIEWGSFLEYTGEGNHDIFILGWTVVTGDADAGLFPLFHSSNLGTPGNRSFYSNPIVDDLIEQARMTSDQNIRNELYLQVSEILIEEVPKIITFYPTFAFTTSGIENLFVNFNNVPFFHHAYLAN